MQLDWQLHDFLVEDLANWYPEIIDKIKITLVEALPNVLPMFSKQLMWVYISKYGSLTGEIF